MIRITSERLFSILPVTAPASSDISRGDIQLIVKFGYPSIDIKVVNSGKHLNVHIGNEEADMQLYQLPKEKTWCASNVIGNDQNQPIMKNLLNKHMESKNIIQAKVFFFVRDGDTK